MENEDQKENQSWVFALCVHLCLAKKMGEGGVSKRVLNWKGGEREGDMTKRREKGLYRDSGRESPQMWMESAR